jgi:excisionase family DNA binding protein
MEPHQQVIDSDFMTPKQIAFHLKLSLRSVYRLIEDGTIPSYSPTPRTYRVAKKDFDFFLQSIKN